MDYGEALAANNGVAGGMPETREPALETPTTQGGVLARDTTRAPLLGWPDRLQQGNNLLRRLLPDRVAQISLPNDLDYNSKTLLVAPYDGAENLILTFGGNTGYLMLPPPIVMLPNAHLVALRDPQRCFGLCGIPGLGDNYRECLGNLRQIIAALGAKRVYCIGVSAGGYPALRYGLDLGAHGVLGFSAPTTLDLADDGDAPLSRYPQLTALYRQRQKIDFDLDMVRSFAVAPKRPRCLLLYSPSSDRDAWLAKRMAGIEGVELDEVSEEAGHRVFLWLNGSNGVPHYIERLLALQPVGAGSAAS
jgi:hypothetical protein